MLQIKIEIYADKQSLGRAAAEHAARSLRRTLGEGGSARVVAATGASQFEFLDGLTAAPGIDWSRVEVFHLDEYVGLPSTHPASFRKYVFERLIQKVGITRYYLLDGDGDPQESVKKVGATLLSKPVDLLFAGIGENGGCGVEKYWTLATLPGGRSQALSGSGNLPSMHRREARTLGPVGTAGN